MPEITYENVAPLVFSTQQSDRTLRFAFRCPVSGNTVESSYTLPKDNSMSTRVATTAKRSLLSQVRWSVSRAIRQAFGHGVIGRIVGDVVGSMADSMARGATEGSSISDGERRSAAVEAFKRVSRSFVWDDKGERWISTQAAKDTLSAFEQQLAAGPISAPYDRSVMSRMLVEVSSADGRLSRDEEAMLIDFLDAAAGSPQSLAQRAPLSKAELGETASGASRETMLMLAWALALCDEELADSERKKLDAYAHGLGLSPSAAQKARINAQTWVLEQVLDRIVHFGGGFTEQTRDQLRTTAKRLGMSEDEAAVVEARYQKRKGLY